MASYFSLRVYACVVLCVSFGNVLCAGGGSEASSSSEHWMSGKKMRNVSLIKTYYNNETHPNGLLQAILVRDTDGSDLWCWEFYRSDEWVNVNGGQGKYPDEYYHRFAEYAISNKKRKGKNVKFVYKPKEAKLSINYAFDFAEEQDAVDFTGEAPGKKSTKCKLLSGCV